MSQTTAKKLTLVETTDGKEEVVSTESHTVPQTATRQLAPSLSASESYGVSLGDPVLSSRLKKLKSPGKREIAKEKEDAAAAAENAEADAKKDAENATAVELARVR